MKCAVVVAPEGGRQLDPLTELRPACLLPLMDRPFLQHLVEVLVAQGISEMHFILSEHADQIEELLGDGIRWGCRFQHHLARDPARPYSVLRVLARRLPAEPFALVHADRLPGVALADTPCMFTRAAGEGGRDAWLGWACVRPELLAALPADADRPQLEALLRAQGLATQNVQHVLEMGDFHSLVDAHRQVLASQGPGLLLTGREREPGIRLGRNVRLHPTARLIAPVFVGENVYVGKGALLGPNVVVGRDCVIDSASMVENSVILPGTYVGENLDLIDVIADREQVVNVPLGVSMKVPDAFVLGSIASPRHPNRLSPLLSRILGCGLLLVLWPVLLLVALWLRLTRAGPVFYRRDVVRLPTAPDPQGWRSFSMLSFVPDGTDRPGLWELLLRVLPALWHVARGDLQLFGVTPRSADELLELPAEWQTLCLRSYAGAIPVSRAWYGSLASPDELYAAEAMYCVRRDLPYELQVVLGYAAQCTSATPEEQPAAKPRLSLRRLRPFR
ncbi:MAG: sugar phosphate nucleotidyltransferase [Candidatus Xenobia bacterium]